MHFNVFLTQGFRSARIKWLRKRTNRTSYYPYKPNWECNRVITTIL